MATASLHHSSISIGKGKAPSGKEEQSPSKTIDVNAHPATSIPLVKKRGEVSFGSTSDLHLKRKQTKRVVPLVETEVRRSTRLKTKKRRLRAQDLLRQALSVL